MRSGQLSIQLLTFVGVTIILIGGFSVVSNSVLTISMRNLNKANAVYIAEAGIEYYRWHLAHSPTNYQDGTGNPGPYVHNYYDKNGNLIGAFTLEITAPLSGSTIVTVKSSGTVTADPSVIKIIQVRMGIPSFAKYAWVLNDNVNFGATAEVFGPIHTNAGLHFDGLAHNLITSALPQYDDPDHAGALEYGIHTHRSPIDPLPPTPMPSRPDVFAGGRQVAVPAVPFGGITQNLSQIKTDAISNGFYAPSSTAFGYDVLLKTNGTFDLYKVTVLAPAPGGCFSPGGSSQVGWGTWSIQTETLINNYPYPTNGLMFLEDNIWVRGQVSSTRILIASGRFPSDSTTWSSITINNNVLYSDYLGKDSIGMIAQRNINIGLLSDDNLRIDAALIAQNGRFGRYSYPFSACGATRSRALLTTFGIIGTNLRAGLYYSSTNGYQARSYNYDTNLLYAPPPSFPLSSSQYIQISWDEVK